MSQKPPLFLKLFFFKQNKTKSIWLPRCQCEVIIEGAALLTLC